MSETIAEMVDRVIAEHAPEMAESDGRYVELRLGILRERMRQAAIWSLVRREGWR